MSMPATDLLVIGAGPAGAATALRAAAAGLRVRLIDRARFPRDKPCAEYLSPETLRQLDLLGVLPAIDAAGGTPIAGTTVVGPRGARLTGLFAETGVTPFRPLGLSLPRIVLDTALVEAARAAGVEVLEGTVVTDLLHDRGAVSGVATRDLAGRTRLFHARLTVGADGLRSVVARRLGVARHGRPARLAFVAHVGTNTGLSDRAEMHVGRHGYVGLNPLPGGLTNVALVVPAHRATRARGNPTRFLFDALADFPGLRGRIDPRHIVRPVLVTGPFASRATGVVANGALLVGDAAEFYDPFTGDGIGSALHGAALAAETLIPALQATGPATATRLAGYPRARRDAFAGKRAVERLIAWAMLAPRLFDRALERLEARNLGHTLVGVAGALVPPRTILHPRFLASALW